MLGVAMSYSEVKVRHQRHSPKHRAQCRVSCKECLCFAKIFNVVGCVVGINKIVMVKINRQADDVGERHSKVHEGDVYQNLTSFGPSILEAYIREYYEKGSNDRQGTGEPHNHP